jgi:UDP-N-acetylmuramate dehydrogenase
MISSNVSLKKYNSFGLDYKADTLITIVSEDDAVSVLKEKEKLKKPILIIGSGSNILFTKDFKGTLLHPKIEGITIEEEQNDYVIISAGSGINWDDFVEWSVVNGYGGLENLSLIPGTVGASAVQNIGAYGVEVKETIDKVRAVSVDDGSKREFSNNECRFAYRNSIFKNNLKSKYLITRVYFKLATKPQFHLDYGLLGEEVRKTGEPTLRRVREAVIAIRRRKLPDPKITGNAGSFFKNPVVSNSIAETLKKQYPKIPVYEYQSGEKKLAAGWLIDSSGWKGKRIGNTGVHENQALVLVNYGRATGKEIFMLSEKIKKSVQKKFGINLEREVEVI